MSASQAREQTWRRLESQTWDVVIVGGGITGVGILHEATRRGLQAVLVEQGDFASGTSSRSSKLVHGGLRYLATGDLKLTWQSVRERERLLDELPGLVEPIGFLMASYEGDKLGKRMMRTGLRIYDFFGSGVPHKPLSAADLLMLAPRLRLERLSGGFWYRDAQTDDARLVLRVLFDAIASGGAALNYARVEELIDRAGQVGGVILRDRDADRVARVEARAVVNATGAWADRLRTQLDAKPVIRPLRGSHLLFPSWRFPVAQAVAFRDPKDQRPLFAYPWEGLTLLGTTDLDHERSLDEAPSISEVEARSMVEAARAAFPGLSLSVKDAVSTYAGVRPVIGTGKKDPSKESREHIIWNEKGLVTVTGGKLTTFREIAREAVDAFEPLMASSLRRKVAKRGRFPTPPTSVYWGALDAMERRRLAGRYGTWTPALVEAAREGELERIPETYFRWAELRHAARVERVEHLEDLLLRRVRVGLLLPDGGREHLERVRGICQDELGWDDGRWEREAERYLRAWETQHRPPNVSDTEKVIHAPRASAPRAVG